MSVLLDEIVEGLADSETRVRGWSDDDKRVLAKEILTLMLKPDDDMVKAGVASQRGMAGMWEAMVREALDD